METTRIEIYPEGIYRWSNPEFLGTAEAAISAGLSAPPTTVKDFDSIRADCMDADVPYSLVINTDGTVTIDGEIPRLRLNTHFAPFTDTNGTTFITPTFKSTPVSVEQTLDWLPPAGSKLRFVSNVGRDSGSTMKCCIYLLIEGVGTRRLPVGNVFADTSICMGHNFSYGRRDDESLISVYQRALAHFDSASSNSDLHDGSEGQSRGVFRWDPESDEQAPVTIETLTTNTRASSHHVYSALY